MATSIDISPADGGAGVSQAVLQLYLTVLNTQTAIDLTLDNSKSPIYIETRDLTTGNNAVTLPTVPKAPGGLIIKPPDEATYNVTFKGPTSGDVGLVLHKTAPFMVCFEQGSLPATVNLNWPFTTFAAGTACTFDPATDKITFAGGVTFVANDRVRFTATTLPEGILADTWYYVVSPGAGEIKIATESGGTAIDITTAGTGTKIYAANRFQLYWF